MIDALEVEIRRFLVGELLALDERRWDDWLTHYHADCQYWVPAWQSEDQQTQDPDRELSLVYYPDRSGLEDRVWRVKSGRSVASVVLPRTQHAFSNLQVQPSDSPDECRLICGWTVHQFLPKEKTVEIFFGRYERHLVRERGQWLNAQVKVILLNDYLPSRLDFYSL